MARIVFVVAMLAVTIYAAADWHRTPEDEMPGKIAKPIWLMIILFTATIAAIGPIAWLVLRRESSLLLTRNDLEAQR